MRTKKNTTKTEGFEKKKGEKQNELMTELVNKSRNDKDTFILKRGANIGFVTFHSKVP